MMIKRHPLALVYMLVAGMILLLSSCKKNLPDARLTLGNDAAFTTTTYEPVLGRNTLFTGNFNIGNSTLSQPLDFKIINLRRKNGDAAPELTENHPTLVWKQPYLGTEKSLEEIEAKRKIEYHPVFEIREHSGQFLMWAGALSTFVKVRPDSGYVFDVEVSNSGGRRYFRDFKLKPFRERAYEPSNVDPISGNATNASVNATIVNNIKGERTLRNLGGNDVAVFFRKIGTGKSITFKFLDSAQNVINPNIFALTKWETLVHGFNMKKTNTEVTYDVAYPIPLINYVTKYTNPAGNRARVVFRFERLGFGGIREEGNLGIDFSIFEEGSWEVIFQFRGENPKFSDN